MKKDIRQLMALVFCTSLLLTIELSGCSDDDTDTGGDGDGGGNTDVQQDGTADADGDVASDAEPDGVSDAGSDSGTDSGALPPLGDDATVLFLHHSTGGVIWSNGAEDGFGEHNAANGTSYSIVDAAYPDDPYPWANYPYDYWNIWVNNEGSSPYMGQDTLEILTPSYDVIVFKHCFPVSNMVADEGPADIASSTPSRQNYELQYLALRDKLRSFPDTRFVVWTGAANVDPNPADTYQQEEAQRASDFFAWVHTEWDEPDDNIFVWDFWQLETDGGLFLPEADAESPGDSHPNSTFAASVAPLFIQRLIDVIEGRGDTGSLTGE